jgi:hypothetical protein
MPEQTVTYQDIDLDRSVRKDPRHDRIQGHLDGPHQRAAASVLVVGQGNADG